MGKKDWFIIDGYRPPSAPAQVEYEGHECYMILNTGEKDAHCTIDVYFEDHPPVKEITFIAPAERITSFRADDRSVFKDLDLKVNMQYSLHISSDEDVIIQYGRCDVSQPNLAYMATPGYSD